MAVVAPSTRRPRADLALEQGDTGAKFVTTVVLMMTVLATLAVGGALVVNGLRSTWVNALSGHMTIEVPVAATDGTLREAGVIDKAARDLRDALVDVSGVSGVRVISRTDVRELVEPWLGDGAGSDDLPLPGLLALTLNDPDDETIIADVTKAAQEVDASAIAETHQTWLSDLRRFSLVLLLASLGMAGITIACAIFVVMGAVRARLDAHQADIDLLHVMGATDSYIGNQFVRVVVRDVGRAALAGALIGLVFLKIAGVLAGQMQSAMLPALRWDIVSLLWFAACPALVVVLCWWAARFTVLRSLRVMP